MTKLFIEIHPCGHHLIEQVLPKNNLSIINLNKMTTYLKL